MSVKKTNFYFRSSLFTVLSLCGAALNYLLYPVLARILDVRSFGDFTAIFALSNQVLGILLAFNLVSIYLVKAYPEVEARKHAEAVQKVLIRFFLIISLLLVAFSPILRYQFKIQNTYEFLILGLILLISVPSVIWNGYLQGHKKLINVGAFNISAAFFKFSLAIVLAGFFGTIGGLWGLLLGTVVGIFVLRVSSSIKLPTISSIFKPIEKSERIFLLDNRYYIFGAIFVVGSLSVLQNIDILLAKSLFSQQVAGIYGGISVLSNALYYISFLLIWILLPEVSSTNHKHNKRLLRTSTKLLATLAVCATLGEVILKNVLVKVLLGNEFTRQSHLLVFATLYQLSLVAITLYAYYLLVLRQRRSLLLTISVVACCISLPLIFGRRDPEDLIISLWLSVLLSYGIYWAIIYSKEIYAGIWHKNQSSV